MLLVSGLVSRVKEKTYIEDGIAALLLATFSGLILFGLTADWPSYTHDAVYHFQRTEALAGALRAGVIFPRWFPNLMFGYGIPVLNYYSPGFYYPAALLHLAGLDLVSSMRFTLSLGFAISAWWMFRLSRLHVSLWPAMVSVICFQFFPYRIYDLFIRGAFPEFSAFVWLPLIALYTIQAATVGRKDSGASSHPTSMTKAGLGLGRADCHPQPDRAHGAHPAWRPDLLCTQCSTIVRAPASFAPWATAWRRWL